MKNGRRQARTECGHKSTLEGGKRNKATPNRREEDEKTRQEKVRRDSVHKSSEWAALNPVRTDQIRFNWKHSGTPDAAVAKLETFVSVLDRVRVPHSTNLMAYSIRKYKQASPTIYLTGGRPSETEGRLVYVAARPDFVTQ